MTVMVPITMFGWPLAVLALFATRPPRQAVLISFVLALLFLPVAGYELPGLPDYTKMTATSYAVLLGVLLFDFGRVSRFRLSWIDIPMMVFCISPMASSLANGLGAYDGASTVLSQIISWGVPYLVGRLYLADQKGIHELAVVIFVGGLVYIPFCLYEIRMSPQLHKLVYGFHQHDFGQTKRFGGFRPMVFMQHGLAVGLWMTCASLVAVWMWRTGALRQVKGWSISIVASGLLVTTVLCKSAGSLALLALGTATLFATQWINSKVFLACLIAAPLVYMGFRASGDWSGESLVAASRFMGDERAESLRFRMKNEDLLAEKAWQRPVFGWGGWSRNRVYDDRGRDVSVTDGLWIIVFGQRGLVGLGALYSMLLLPVGLLVSKLPTNRIADVENAAVVVTGVLIVLFATDCIFNAMPNPLFVAAAGGLTSFVFAYRLPRPRSAAFHGSVLTSQPSVRPH